VLIIVRQKAKDITALLSDEARLKEERRSRNAMRDRMSGRAPGDYDAQPAVYDRPGYGDDDRDLQRALEESRRMAQNESKTRRRFVICFLRTVSTQVVGPILKQGII
jgi:epsin